MAFTKLLLIGGLLILGTAGSQAAGIVIGTPPAPPGLVQPAHSLGQAEAKLYRRGYYDVQIERESLPYSFSACKRGVRYHIHIDDYGDFVDVNERGPCRGRYDGYDPRPNAYYEGPWTRGRRAY